MRYRSGANLIHMKVLGYIALHYGKDYLQYAIRSMYESVDEILILYTSTPCHGSATSLKCPDTREELVAIVQMVDQDNKVKWTEGKWAYEGQQRDTAYAYARSRSFDIIVTTDADEVWKPGILKELIQLTYDKKASKCLIWMRHLWRSFNYICDDAMRQERINYLGSDKKELIYAPYAENQVWHFGYARSVSDIAYKISIHGHSGEWLLSKQRWLEEKYMPFPPASDVHPVCKDTWNPKPFDKRELPEIMMTHPFYNSELVK